MRLATHCARAVDQGRGCEAPVCATSMGQAARDTTGFRAVRQECGGGSRGTKKCPEQPGRPGCRSGVRLSGCPVRQPPLGLPNPQSLRTNGIIPAYASIVKHFRKQFLKQFSYRLAIEERRRGVAPRYALPSPGRFGGGGCEAPVCARSMGRAARDTTGLRAVRQECGGGSRGTKSVLSNRGARGAFRDSAFRLPGQRASLWHSILSHSGQAASYSVRKHCQAPKSTDAQIEAKRQFHLCDSTDGASV